ncbi:MAG: phage tail protein [Chloroflexi bacterium]|nr:phage tail protein [Chloroflexota bacterium]
MLSNTHRQDPYKNFKFRVQWDGKYIPGIIRVSCLKRSTQPVISREGGDPSSSRLSPSTWRFEPVVLERGITHDEEFETWANLSYRVSGPMSLRDFRKDITVELLNEQGTVVKAFKVYRCWVSEYQVLPTLDASANSVAIETLTLENEGWERDTGFSEPAET